MSKVSLSDFTRTPLFLSDELLKRSCCSMLDSLDMRVLNSSVLQLIDGLGSSLIEDLFSFTFFDKRV